VDREVAEPEVLRRGREFHAEVQAELRRDGSLPLAVEHTLHRRGARRRLDVWIAWRDDDPDQACAGLVEIKATDWDAVDGPKVRTYARTQARQLLEYLAIAIDVERVGGTPTMLFRRAPVDPFRRVAVEATFAEAGLQVTWRETDEVTSDTLMLAGIKGMETAELIEAHLADIGLGEDRPAWFVRMLRRPLRPLPCATVLPPDPGKVVR
jgi:hypothetical protein